MLDYINVVLLFVVIWPAVKHVLLNWKNAQYADLR